MNLMMYGVEYNDISINYVDIFESDWLDGVVDGKDNLRMFDVVMVNLFYLVYWNNKDCEDDFCWCEYGIVLKIKVDYVFLFYCLYYLEDNGWMVIILFYGVLFRGVVEGCIWKVLIDKY